jgi:hypothetical protein
MELYELLRKADGAAVDFLREGVRTLAQALMDLEVTAQVGAERGERAPERRTAQRNGYRPREWDTRVGTVELQVPKLRAGSLVPSILEPRRRAERALASVVMACYVEGVSTRRVDEVARAMGIEQISKSQVSRICQALDELVDVWRNRPLDTGPYPLVWIDALSMRVREGGRICSTAVLYRLHRCVRAAGAAPFHRPHRIVPGQRRRRELVRHPQSRARRPPPLPHPCPGARLDPPLQPSAAALHHRLPATRRMGTPLRPRPPATIDHSRIATVSAGRPEGSPPLRRSSRWSSGWS